MSLTGRLAMIFVASVLWLTGCGRPQGPTPSATFALASPTPAPPTATPEPLAASVNGEPIRLVDFEQEVLRFESAKVDSGTDLATLGEYRTQVLQALIDRRLLAQGAVEHGMVVTQDELDQSIENLATELGGNEAMGVWLATVGYTLEGFISALSEEMLAAKMIDLIVAEAPEVSLQVHARHILVTSVEEAERIRELLLSGEDFADLARQYSLDASTRPAGGDLSWFPRGYLLIPEVEEAAFSLEPGEISEVVTSILGFHIVQTLERMERELEPEPYRQLREMMVEEWLSAQHQAGEIQIFIVP
jgi:parvulin-like peptidyl-prolyl isomerase